MNISAKTGMAGLMLAGLWPVSPVYAQAKDPISFEIEVGAEYDDNITVDETDTTSRKGDSSLRLSGGVAGYVVNKKDTSLQLRYNFFQSLHDELTAFDLQMHGLSARAKADLGKVNLGATYRYDYVRLGGEKLMEMHTVNPDIGFLVAKKTYLTAEYEFKTFSFADPTQADRNADRHSVAAKVYFLLGKGKNITTGYKVSRHKAGTDTLSYWGQSFDAGLKLPVALGEKSTTFRLRYQYRLRDYSGINAGIGDERSDKRHTLRAIYEVPFGDAFEGRLEYKYIKSNSNLPVVDYTSNTVRASLSWKF